MKNEELIFGENEEKPRDYYQITDYTNKTIDKRDDPNRKFINGFKAIKIGEETYAFVRESDKKIMPYYYDNAYDFNDYGFAIVGREGVMTWINKDFKYLRDDRRSGCYGNEYAMSEDYLHDPYRILYGFHSVGEFSKGDIPLSRIRVGDESAIYFGTDGEVKKFTKYNNDDTRPLNKFERGTPFNKNGMAIAEFNKEKLILFAEGFYIGYNDLAKLGLDNGYVERFRKETGKTLKKVR